MSSSPGQVNSKPPKFNRNMLIVIGGLGLSIVSIIILVIFMVTALNPSGNGGTVSPPTPKPSESVTPTPTQIPVNNKARIALKIDAQLNEKGSLWQISPQDLQREQLLNGAKVSAVLDYSPDNAYLGVVSNFNGVERIAFWDTDNEQLLASTVPYSALDIYRWKDDSTFSILKFPQGGVPEINNINVHSLNVTTETLGTRLIVHEADAAPDFSRLIFSEKTNGDLILYNRNNARQVVLKTAGTVMPQELAKGAWINNKDYVFYAADALYLFDTDLITIKSITTLRSAETDPINSAGIIPGPWGDTFYFIFESRLYRYNLSTNVTSELYDLRSLIGANAVNFSVSPNGNYVALAMNGKTYILDLEEKRTNALCENICTEGVFEN